MYGNLSFTNVAWVPWSWEPQGAGVAHQLSMDWALEQADAVAARPVLRVHTHAHDWTHSSSTYAPYAEVATVVTDRGRGAMGPTLVPGAHSTKLVAGGMSCADGFALVIEEHPALPLGAWAAELGAPLTCGPASPLLIIGTRSSSSGCEDLPRRCTTAGPASPVALPPSIGCRNSQQPG